MFSRVVIKIKTILAPMIPPNSKTIILQMIKKRLQLSIWTSVGETGITLSLALPFGKM